MDISSLYKHCRLCPRGCGVDRLSDETGYCGESSQLRLAFAGLHRGEEPPLSGEGGSGTVFVTGCNLGCALCQNWQISGKGNREWGVGSGTPRPSNLGRAVDTEEFVSICLALQDKGAENINIVTGSHAIPALAEGLTAAKAAGLTIPIVWNSSAYENIEALELLNGIVDIFLPDLKTLDSTLAAEFFNAPDYPQVASQAILWMVKQSLPYSHSVIIRHLIIPGHLESTRAVLRWFADTVPNYVHNNVPNNMHNNTLKKVSGGTVAGKAALSLMSQYTPIAPADKNGNNPGRFVSETEYDTVLGWLDEFGIEDGFCQELVTGSDWLPDFTRPNPFSSELSVPVWHYSG